MIDPIHSLAFSIQANPGVYAVLVGSGISRAAKIPTGWEITLHLIRKLAVLHEENCEPDPERWYRDKFDKEADYSDLLDALAKTHTERQQLLRPYWEPNDQEREEDVKRPTAAHHAIAALAAPGFIKVILTTNFDRLMEGALRDQGLEPVVLSSPDQIQGALPLIHTRCSVIKLHGDYLDTRIRNTSSELAQYSREFDELLDRILDEFGLIICGWSAEWDGALRTAISRAPSRRFTTYWAAHGTLGDEAQRLIAHRGAHVVRIEDADTFFTTIQQHVESIQEFSRPHPLSVDAAIASLKRYLPEPRYRIRLSDLVDETVDRIVEAVSGDDFSVNAGSPTPESVTVRVRRYEAVCSTLLAMAAVGGFWAEEEHYDVWRRALERLGSNVQPIDHYHSLWFDLQRYPATLLFYALGLGSVESGRLRFVEHLLGTTIRKQYENISAVEILPPFFLLDKSNQNMRILEGMEGHYAPLNHWIHDMLWQHFQNIIPHKDKYTLRFDKFEMLIALNYLYRVDQPHSGDLGPRAPLGDFGYRYQNRTRIMKEIEESLSEDQDDSLFVRSGIFGKNTKDCMEVTKQLQEFVSKWGWR